MPMFSKHSSQDRKDETKKYGGGVMLLVPISLQPKIRKDLNYLNTKTRPEIHSEQKRTYRALGTVLVI